MPADLARVARERVPLAELSGLCSLVRDGTTTLVALGDDDVALAITTVGDDGRPGPWEVVTAAGSGAAPSAQHRFTQLESVALDGAGRAWVLTEGTSLLAGVDLTRRTPVAVVGLDTSTIPELHASWSAPDASRAEGLALLVEGHLLVVKEKDPAGLVELGPAGSMPLGVTASTLLPQHTAFEPEGDTVVALAWWPWPHDDVLADLSDLAVDHEGGLWVLSDQSRRLAGIRLPLAPGAAPELGDMLTLPKKISKPEGLAFLPGGVIAVADDRHDDDGNLWLLRREP